MSKPIQTVEELDAVLHWRGKHAQAIRERDALQQRLTATSERNDLAIDLLRRARAVVEGGGWTALERDIAKFLNPRKPVDEPHAVEDSHLFDTCRLIGGKFNLYAEQPAPIALASRDESIAWLKRIDGIGQARAELIYSMGFRRHTDVSQS